MFKRVNELGYTIQLSDKAKDFIARKGFDSEYGARPLKRAIQKYLEDLLAEEIINSKLKEGDTIFIDFNEETTEITIKIDSAKPEIN